MTRLYSNENFPLPVVEALRALGHNVLTSFNANQAGQAIPDRDVLEYAVSAERGLLTMNRRHFIGLHNQNSEHFGIIVCTVDPDFSALAQRIHEVIQGHEKLNGQLIRVNRPG